MPRRGVDPLAWGLSRMIEAGAGLVEFPVVSRHRESTYV